MSAINVLPIASLNLRGRRKSTPNTETDANHGGMLIADATAAVVLIVSATLCGVELPEATCAGENVHVVSAGRFEQEKRTLSGNVVDVAEMFTAKLAKFPAGAETVAGFTPRLRSKFWLDAVTVKVT